MKINSIICSAAMLFSFAALAQQPAVYEIQPASMAGHPAVQPVTTVLVSLTIEKETVRTGPYARYAQKYLGVVAPLADRDTYSITGAGISYLAPGVADARDEQLPASGYQVLSHVRNDAEFPKATLDRTSVREKTAEDMAREAAATIFTLRKRRIELLSGEMGEHVFGEGMRAAIEELERLENEHLALFLGKQTRTVATRTFEVVPVPGKTSYVVCRFSPTEGIVPDSDLGANPVVLTVTPENLTAGLAAGKREAKSAAYRIADYAACVVMDDSGELTRTRVPVYQLGATVYSIPGK